MGPSRNEMAEFAESYWPYFFEVLVFTVAIVSAGHAIMTNRDVRGAVSGIAIVLLLPLLGATLYAVFGINRIRRERLMQKRSAATARPTDQEARAVTSNVPFDLPGRFIQMNRLGDMITEFPLRADNEVKLLETDDICYETMLEAIDAAKQWILLEAYIFDADILGRRFVDSLASAQKRGVQVRVLIDAIGAHYSRPRIANFLLKAGVPHAHFMGNMIGAHFRVANLRTHRKMLIVDGTTCFLGGMNIRRAFSQSLTGRDFSHDTHFAVRGPVVGDFAQVFAGDWKFTTGEYLPDEAIASNSDSIAGEQLARAVASGPDHEIECTHDMIVGVLSIAERKISIATPYFLPDLPLIDALATAARRGVAINIAMPAKSNLPLIDCAVTAHLEEVVKMGCQVWRTRGPFDHSKLISVNNEWAYVGSSNLDPRSFRLNFEIDMEVYGPSLACWIEAHINTHIANAELVTVDLLSNRPLWQKMRDRVFWLGSPYM